MKSRQNRRVVVAMACVAAGAFAPHAAFAQSVAPITSATTMPRLPDGAVRRRVPSKGWLIGRLLKLPLCAVGDPALATSSLVAKGWECKRELRNCTIDWANHRVNEPSYFFRPMMGAKRTIEWRSDDALYGVHELWCTRYAASASYDHVNDYHASGRASPRSSPQDRYIDVEIAHLYGGFAEHDRPVYVQSTITVARSPEWVSDYDDDLTVALQVLRDGGWEDFATRDVTTTGDQRTYVVAGTVAPLHDVRVEVRGKYDRKHRVGATWLIKDVQIFVEHCFREEGNPDLCIE